MNRIFNDLVALFDWRTGMVLRRNAKVYMRNWKTAFLPPAMEPVIFFMAFGMGLGAFIGMMNYEGHEVEYGTYVAPGLLAYTSFSSSFFEGLYGSYIRMFYQKTWDGMLGTQLELRHILWGEIIWAGCRGGMNATVVMVVLFIFHSLDLINIYWEKMFFLLPVCFLAGWAFGSFAMIFTAIVPSIDHMNYPVFLIGIPLGLVSNTYFPLEARSPAFEDYLQLNPLYHLAELNRGILLSGEWMPHFIGLLLSGGTLLLICMLISQRLMERRLLED